MARGQAVTLIAFAIAGCGRLSFDPTENGCPGQVEQPVTVPAKYVSPAGSNANPGTRESPWGTIAYALTNAAADEHVVLLDGLYTEPLIVDVPNRTVRAENDGGPIFDGGGTENPCRVMASDVTVEGVHCRRGASAAFDVLMASNVTVRRVTAHTGISADVFHVGNNSSDVLLEDVAAWGPASRSYQISRSSRVTVRRCWARWDGAPDVYNTVFAIVDNTFDARIENCVLTSNQPYDAAKQTVGFGLFSQSERVDRTQLIGSVVYGMPNWSAVVSTEASRIEGTRISDNVYFRNGAGLYQRSDADFGVDHMTSVDMVGAGAFVLGAHTFEPKNGDFEIAGYVTSSVLGRSMKGFDISTNYLTSFAHTNNTLFELGEPYAGTTADASEQIVDPGYDRVRYGDGAYLIRNTLGTGAEVLYQVENGVVTDKPLWPWPLEDRILAESGSSVTWESGGGMWRALPDELVDDACP